MKMRGRGSRNGRLLVVMVWVLAALGWMGSGEARGQEALSKVEVVSADTANVSPRGATFTVPAGWSLETGKDVVLLTPPETDTHLAIFDAQAPDAAAAVKAAWAAYKGGQTHPVKIVTPRPAREGWDERQVFDYETSPNERAVIQAIALRAGTTWTVFLIDGMDPTVEKRSSPLQLIYGSLRPKRYQRESFAGRQVHILSCITSNVHMSSSETREFGDEFVTQELDQVHPQDARIIISLRKRSRTCKYISACQ